MIVRHESDGSLVMITQNDHAKAAGFCATHWGNAQFEKPRPLESTLRAAFLHDLTWLREETCPRFNPENGRTINYLDVRNETQLDEYQWANEWLSKSDLYAGLLVSKHRTGIWKSRYGLMTQPHYAVRKLSPEIEAFVARSHAEQDIAAAEFDRRELLVNYVLLQIWDLLSLYICSNERLKEESYDPVPTGYAEGASVAMQLTPVTATSISVEPFPFNRPSLDVSVVYRRLPTVEFKDERAFRKAYFGAAPQIATFTFLDPATRSQ
jgi:hypothetical protein